MSDSASALSQQLLIALPGLVDPNFSRSVVMVCQHDADGAMGIVVNRASEFTLGELFDQLNIAGGDPALRARQVVAGGPVHAERGFVLHDGDHAWDSSIRLPGGLSLTTSRDVLQALADGQGPAQALVALGCAGWGAGQLESELQDNAWLVGEADEAIVFGAEPELKWAQALARIGVDPAMLSGASGHA